MNRTAILLTFAFIGFMIAFASAMPATRPGAAATAAGEEVPAQWMARALSARPFMPPAPR
ncbi:hypothetical protein [Roseomonas sp. AR75]|jgi:ABC-type xylose transport system permease subunit|uniref:hypothetical protein n=1 Tax=Roseomonas sp. AR75 TaxID=2562311 RepID=UPI0010BFF264|nr:hypothetical protein [Roseomonas sp. AR75]